MSYLSNCCFFCFNVNSFHVNFKEKLKGSFLGVFCGGFLEGGGVLFGFFFDKLEEIKCCITDALLPCNCNIMKQKLNTQKIHPSIHFLKGLYVLEWLSWGESCKH